MKWMRFDPSPIPLDASIGIADSVKVKLLAKIDIVNRQTQRLLGTLLE